MKKTHIPQEINQEQVKNILKFIDASQDESVKKSIFGQLLDFWQPATKEASKICKKKELRQK